MVKTMYIEEKLDIPAGVEVTADVNHHITVKGPNGLISKDFSHVRGIKIIIEGDSIIFSANFVYTCKICYSHFPFNAEIKKKSNEIHFVNFLGERAPRMTKYLDNVSVEVQGDDVILTGPDKETLGQTAANMKKSCRIRKKDQRVFQDGVYLYKIQSGDDVLWQIR
jgi:large subunit ribosomal protein L6